MRIKEAKFVKSAVYPKDYHISPYAEVAFVGKSNVGKSSMINTLLNRKSIAKISSTPGKTKLVNFFEVRFESNAKEEGFINFVDLPGYGYAKVSKNERNAWKKMVGDYLDNRINLRAIMILIDIRHKLDPKDIAMIDMVRNKNIKFGIIATKSDKIKKTQILHYIKKLKVELGLDEQKIIPFSSLKKTGVDQVLGWIEEIIL